MNQGLPLFLLLLVLIGGTATWGAISLFMWKSETEMQVILRLLGILRLSLVALAAFGIGSCFGIFAVNFHV